MENQEEISKRVQKLLYMEVQCQKLLSIEVQRRSLKKEQKSMYLVGTRKYIKSIKGSQRFLSGSCASEVRGQRNRV